MSAWHTPRGCDHQNETWETKQKRNAWHLENSTSSSRTKGVGGPTLPMQAQLINSTQEGDGDHAYLSPLVHGATHRVGRLRGYGNAINPYVAAAFIRAYLGDE